MKCFQCPNDFNDVDTFFSHIQTTHGVKGKTKCTCTLCFSDFGDFSVFKKHVRRCSKNGLVTNMNTYNAIIGSTYNEKLENFKYSLRASALDLALRISAKPNFPRNATFVVINEIEKYIQQITDGMKTIMFSEPENISETLLSEVITTVEQSFHPINTEGKLTALLDIRNLTEDLIRVDVALNRRIDNKEKYCDEEEEEDEEEEDDEGEEEGEDDEEEGEVKIEKPKCSLVVMPIAHQIKQFFELPDVFDKVQAHVASIQSSPHLNHFIKGSVWKEKISNYSDTQLVFPYNFYGDGVQLNNPLGNHTKPGLVNFNYITFPSLPPEYQSRLNNIMLASLCEDKTIKTYGTEAVFRHVVLELKSLAVDGIDLNLNNKSVKIFFVLGLFEGDNKEVNRSLDFAESFNAIYYCRFCTMTKEEMRTATEENYDLRRTEESYAEHVETNNVKLTGIKNWSVFNTMPYYHVINGTTNDLTHDILEGVLPYSHLKTLKHFIYESRQVDMEILSKFEYIAPGIRVVSKEELNLLGAPIFDEGFYSMSSIIINKMDIMFDRLKNLNSHTAYFLLKHCFAIPKLTYFVRTCPAWKFKEFSNIVDSKFKCTLESIMNVSMNENQWLQASLPVKRGGLGIRRIEDISLPAFLSSTFGVSCLVSQILNKPDTTSIHSTESAERKWNSLNDIIPKEKNIQKTWDIVNIDRIIENNLIIESNLDLARFNALQHKESGAWLNAFPSPNIGTFMDDNVFRICVALRLGCKVCERYECSCGSVVDENGIHGLSCPKCTAIWIQRHADINNILHRALSSIYVPSKLEPEGLSRDDGKRPDGLTLIPWEKGQSLVWDTTCIDTLADSYLYKSTQKSGSAAEFAQNKKHSNYSYIKSQNYAFTAFAVESFGPWSSEAHNLIKKIGKKLNEISGDNRSKNFLVQRISLAIQRGNAACVMNTMPATNSFNEVFYI